jgi:hypothetical protein
MAKPKKYDTSQDEPRKVAMDALLRNMAKAKMPEEIRKLWTGFIRIWEASGELRGAMTTMFPSPDVITEFVGRLERAMLLNLPSVLLDSLEGRCGKQ